MSSKEIKTKPVIQRWPSLHLPKPERLRTDTPSNPEDTQYFQSSSQYARHSPQGVVKTIYHVASNDIKHGVRSAQLGDLCIKVSNGRNKFKRRRNAPPAFLREAVKADINSARNQAVESVAWRGVFVNDQAPFDTRGLPLRHLYQRTNRPIPQRDCTVTRWG